MKFKINNCDLGIGVPMISFYWFIYLSTNVIARGI